MERGVLLRLRTVVEGVIKVPRGVHNAFSYKIRRSRTGPTPAPAATEEVLTSLDADITDDPPIRPSTAASTSVDRRCPAGFDNFGECEDRTHPSWHPAGFTGCFDVNDTYTAYDRCRRGADHETDPGAVHPDVHLPDCGGAVFDVQDSTVFDFSDEWLRVFDEIEKSGEKLW